MNNNAKNHSQGWRGQWNRERRDHVFQQHLAINVSFIIKLHFWPQVPQPAFPVCLPPLASLPNGFPFAPALSAPIPELPSTDASRLAQLLFLPRSLDYTSLVSCRQTLSVTVPEVPHSIAVSKV